MGTLARSNLRARVCQIKYMGKSSSDKIYRRAFARSKYMGESSPDQIYGREFARSNIWERVRQIKYMGESSPD